MFIAITFVCMLNGGCQFVFDQVATTEAQCMERNQVLAQILEANDKVTAYRGGCVPIPKENHARS